VMVSKPPSTTLTPHRKARTSLSTSPIKCKRNHQYPHHETGSQDRLAVLHCLLLPLLKDTDNHLLSSPPQGKTVCGHTSLLQGDATKQMKIFTTNFDPKVSQLTETNLS
jgi:hypothetical protein